MTSLSDLIMFDFDGVIADSLEAMHEATVTALREGIFWTTSSRKTWCLAWSSPTGLRVCASWEYPRGWRA